MELSQLHHLLFGDLLDMRIVGLRHQFFRFRRQAACEHVRHGGLSFELRPVAQHLCAAQTIFGLPLQGAVRQHFGHDDRISGSRRHIDHSGGQVFEFGGCPAIE